MSSYQIMFPGIRRCLMFSGFGLKLLFLVFCFIFTIASRLLHLYSTDDKTSRLKMKSFSTLKIHPESFIELHGEDKREEGVRGDANEMKWNQQRREQASQ